MFDRLIPDAQSFLNTLAQNNTRDWFHANKDVYDTKLRAPALALIEDITPRLQSLSELPVTGKLFRPQRDIRRPYVLLWNQLRSCHRRQRHYGIH